MINVSFMLLDIVRVVRIVYRSYPLPAAVLVLATALSRNSAEVMKIRQKVERENTMTNQRRRGISQSTNDKIIWSNESPFQIIK